MGSAGCLTQTRHVEECDQAPADWPATASVEKGAGEVPARQGGLDLRRQCHVCPRPWVHYRVPTVFLRCKSNHGASGLDPARGSWRGKCGLGNTTAWGPPAPDGTWCPGVSFQSGPLLFHCRLMSRPCRGKPGSDRTVSLSFCIAHWTASCSACKRCACGPLLGHGVRSESASAGMKGDLCAFREEPHSAPPGRPERWGARTPVVCGLVLPGDAQEVVSSPGLWFQAPCLLSSVTLTRDLAQVRVPHPSGAPFPAAASSPSLLTRF